jgi:hypothetical protein
VNPWGNGEFTVENWDEMDYACLIMTNGCTTTNDRLQQSWAYRELQ